MNTVIHTAGEAVSEESDAAEVAVDILAIALGIGIGALVGIALALCMQFAGTALLRKRPLVKGAAKQTLAPLRLLLAIVGGRVGLEIVTSEIAPSWKGKVSHALVVMMILAGTWLVVSCVSGLKDVMVSQIKAAGVTRFRKVQTQMQILNRVIIVVIWVIGLSAVLMTFEGARTAGASLFASAGLISVVAGIAAQSTLGNVFAGLQLAFSDSIRMGDIVIWQREYAKVEDITLTYVVLKIWDGRRLIVPSSTLTTQTFENWTREDSSMLGYVDFMVDWSVPIPAMRAELDRLLAKTDLWDGDTGIIQVRATEGDSIKVSALVSARTPSTLIDLQYYVREHLLRWIQTKHPDVVPHGRNYFTPPDPLQEVAALERLENMGGNIPRGMKDAAEQAVARQAQAQMKAHTDPDIPLSSVSGNIAEENREKDMSEKVHIPSWKRGKKKPPGRGISRMFNQNQRDARAESAAEKEEKQEETQTAPTMILPALRTPLSERGMDSQYSDAEETGHESSIFTGSLSALRRAEEFSGPGEAVLKERGEAVRKKEAEEAEEDGTREAERHSNKAFGSGDTIAEKPVQEEKKGAGDGQ